MTKRKKNGATGGMPFTSARAVNVFDSDSDGEAALPAGCGEAGSVADASGAERPARTAGDDAAAAAGEEPHAEEEPSAEARPRREAHVLPPLPPSVSDAAEMEMTRTEVVLQSIKTLLKNRDAGPVYREEDRAMSTKLPLKPPTIIP
eukprot:Rhum_TRINITY_DN22072_c0_g1::Rhum_TRINITY_DN22072_c0_g1_i1::g.175190::m.175190